MKFCMCTVFAKNRPVEDIIDMARALKLDGLELWDGHIREYIERGGDIAGLKALLDEKGLACVIVSPYFKLLTEADVAKSMETAAECAAFAKDLDCGMIRVFTGDKPSASLSPEEWSCCESGVKRLSALACDNNLVMMLENHNGMPADTKEAALRLLKAENSPCLRLIFDGFNFLPDGNDMCEAHEELKDYIAHYHFKNLLWKPHLCVPLDEGDANFEGLVALIKQSGYDGWISFEYFAADPSDMIRKSWEWFNKTYLEA